jgi:hypothetical protein
MRGGKFLLLPAVCLCLLGGCANLYHATSPNPALVQVPNVNHGPNVMGVGVVDSFDLVAVDGQAVGMPMTDRDFRRIDPGTRRLTLVYEGNKRVLGPKFTAPPIVLYAKLEAGHRYKVICESTDVSVKGYVRDLGTGRIVSNVAEASLLLEPAPATVPVPLLIPARH